MLSFISHPDDGFRVGDFLTQGLMDDRWTEFRAAIAFVKRSGTKHIRDALASFNAKPYTSVRISFGVDKGGTSMEGAQDLLSAVGAKGELWIFKNSNSLFHPKIYMFKNDKVADVVVGSVNMTQGGLYENYEASIRVHLDLADEADLKFLESIEASLDYWSTPTEENVCLPFSAALMEVLVASGDLPTEKEVADTEGSKYKEKKVKHPGQSPFGSVNTQPAPKVASTPLTGSSLSPVTETPVIGAATDGVEMPSAVAAPSTSTTAAVAHVAPSSATAASPSAASWTATGSATEGMALPQLIFGMTLQNTDVGVGQTTTGAQGRSPEVFIPILALDMMPSFWGWKTEFDPDLGKYTIDHAWAAANAKWISEQMARPNRKPRPLNKLDWFGVKFLLLGHAGIHDATIWFNPRKKDIRIRNSILRSSGDIDDILLIRQGAAGSGYDYIFKVVPKSDPAYGATLSFLTHQVTNSYKRIGYFTTT